MRSRNLAVWAVGLGAVALVLGAALVLLLTSSDDEPDAVNRWPPFTMTYETSQIVSVHGVPQPPERSVTELRWTSDTSWRKTTLAREGFAGDYYEIDGTTFTRFDASSNDARVDEVDGHQIPEIWFISLHITHSGNENIEEVPNTDMIRRVWTYTFECDEGPGLLCDVTGGQAGSGVETTIYNSHGIPVAFSDVVDSVTITSVTMRSLEFD